MTAPQDDSVPEDLELVAIRLSEAGMQIRPAPPDRPWMDTPNGRFSRRCLPLLMANQCGWELLNGAGFTTMWEGGDDVTAVKIWPDSPGGPSTPISHFGCGILT